MSAESGDQNKDLIKEKRAPGQTGRPPEALRGDVCFTKDGDANKCRKRNI